MKPLVTVVMSCYQENISQVKEAVESVLNQSLKDFVLVIVLDDPSNTELIKLLRDYEAIDNRIKLVIHNKNQGLAVARNTGIEISYTPYVALMDADDISVKDRLEKQILYIESNNCDLLFSHMQYIDEKSSPIGNYFTPTLPTKTDKILSTLLRKPLFGHPTALIKQEVFSNLLYDPEFKKGQDTDLWIRCLLAGYTFDIYPESLLQCRLHRESTDFRSRLSRQQGYAKFRLKIVKKHFKSLHFRPSFWLYAIRAIILYIFLYYTPKRILQITMYLRDKIRG